MRVGRRFDAHIRNLGAVDDLPGILTGVIDLVYRTDVG